MAKPVEEPWRVTFSEVASSAEEIIDAGYAVKQGIVTATAKGYEAHTHRSPRGNDP